MVSKKIIKAASDDVEGIAQVIYSNFSNCRDELNFVLRYHFFHIPNPLTMVKQERVTPRVIVTFLLNDFLLHLLWEKRIAGSHFLLQGNDTHAMINCVQLSFPNRVATRII